MSKTYAAIDIGSNAARLLIKRIFADEKSSLPCLDKLMLLRVPLRLGFDVFDTGKISDKKKENLIRLMKAYKQLMKIYDVERYRACATSAMRDAGNGCEIIKDIKERADIKIDIIDGSEEAKILYANHAEKGDDPEGNYMYVDVGGGSTELNFIQKGKLVLSRSFNVGTVRILTGKVKDSVWSDIRKVCEEIYSKYGTVNLIGSGGNINKLYKLAKRKDEAHSILSVEELQRIYGMLLPMSVKQRMEDLKLKPDRADVIIPAAQIFLTLSTILHSQYIIVPMIGVADGIIDAMIEEDRIKQLNKQLPK